MASCSAWKGKGALHPKREVHLICNYPPQMISCCLKLIGFLESAGGESCRGALTPADLKASTAWPGEPGWAPCASVMQSILVRRQTTDVASCWLHLTQHPMTPPPRQAEDAEKHVALNGASKIHRHTQKEMWVYKSKHAETEEPTHAWTSSNRTHITYKDLLRALHRAAASDTNLIDLPQPSPIMQYKLKPGDHHWWSTNAIPLAQQMTRVWIWRADLITLC